MMNPNGDDFECDQRLQAALVEYMEAVESGAAPEDDEFLARYPEIQEELREFLTNRGRLDELVSPLRQGAGEPDQTPLAEEPTMALGSKAPPRVGAKVTYFGDYELLEEIARGGMGVVYKARQSTLKRIVALKMILSGQLAGEEDVKRFYAEAEAAAKLDHPNIVPVFEIGQHEGQHYFSMAFVEGESLARKVISGPLPPREAARIMKKVTEAVTYAHIEGVIHRDLKPANVLLDKDGEPRVTDFGLAKRVSAESLASEEGEWSAGLTATGQVLGTPSYMPPEQAAGKTEQIGTVSDVYSLGAMLYCLLIGRPPFQAASPIDTLMQVLEKEPLPPRRLDSKIPGDLETICLKCLEKEPQRRYPSAQELAEDLGRYLNDEPVRARRVGPVDRAVRWVRRHRRTTVTAAAAALAAVVLVVGTIGGISFYRQSQFGYLALSTTGPHMVAEVLDENDNAVVPSFPVPTPAPVALPDGDSYRLRLSASGLLSETWPLNVERGRTLQHDVNFRARWLWPPKEVSTDEGHQETEIVDLAGHSDLIILSHRVPGPDGRVFKRLRRLDGATGNAIWSLNFSADTLPAGRELNAWRSLLSPSAILPDPRLVEPPPDLDGDGTRDLVWLSRTSPSLLAISGGEGKILWWHRAEPPLPDGVDKTAVQSQRSMNPGSVVGSAAVADVDDDGTDDLIACFTSPASAIVTTKTGDRIRTQPRSWAEAVSGKSGTSIWRYTLPVHFESFHGSAYDAEKYNAACRPHVVQLTGRPVVVLINDTQLLGLDLTTGKEVWPHHDLGFEPFQAPRVADLDGDGQEELLLIHQHGTRDDVQLFAVSLTTRSTIWEGSFQPIHYVQRLERSKTNILSVNDVNRDGGAEIVVATGDFEDRSRHRWSGIAMLDGGTGKARWQRKLAIAGQSAPPEIDRFITGPDLNGDGWQEVFATWSMHERGKTLRTVLSVVAISGKEGRTLWRWKQLGVGAGSGRDSGPLAWWQPGQDDWPLLLVPIIDAPGGQDVTYVLSAGTGRLMHTLPEVSDPKVADFNGDGIRDLFYTVSPQGAPRMLALRGTPPEPWKRLGRWEPAQDLDGDGFDDLLRTTRSGPANVTVRSGRNGSKLWQAKFSPSSSNQQSYLAPPPPYGDLDGDGTPDLLSFAHGFAPSRRGYGGVSFETVAALSGAEGQRLWTADDFGMSDDPLLDWLDVNADGRAEVAVVSYTKQSRLSLSILSGRDGKLLWQVPIIRGSFGSRPDPYGRKLSDLNGDEVPDLVLWVSKDSKEGTSHFNTPAELRAISGRDGSSLWPTPPLEIEKSNSILWPRPAVGSLDDDGRPDVVAVLRKPKSYDRQRGYECELIALDGQSGQRKWSWSWHGNTEVLPPLLVDFDGAGRHAICLGTSDKDGHQIVILDGDGKIQQRIPLDLPPSSFPLVVQMWNHCDLDGDGKEELLFVSDGKLCASRGKNELFRWQWSLPDEPITHRGYRTGPGRIVEIGPATKERKATIVVWIGQNVYGLAGSTGKPRWRCPVKWSPGTGFSDPPTLHLLSTDDPQGIPRVMSHWRSFSDDRWATICREAWPVSSEGKYEPPTPAPVRYEVLPEPEESGRPLPWAPLYSQWNETLFLPTIVLPALSFMVLVLPALLVCRAIQRRSSTVRLWATLTATGALYAAYATTVERPSNFDGLPVALHALVGLPGAVFFTCLAFSLARRRWRTLRWLLVGSLVLGVVAAVLMLWADSYRMDSSESYSSGGWYWIWFLGAYYTGIVVALGSPLALLRRVRRARVQSSATRAPRERVPGPAV